MAVSRDSPFSSRASRVILALTVATCLCAAVAAAPSAPPSKPIGPAIAVVPVKPAFGESATGMRPLGRGPAIHVGRAYDAEDEDCTLVVTRVNDESGYVRVTRGVVCAN